MLNELLTEIKELQEYKKKSEYLVKEAQKMSDMLFKYMTDEYNQKPYEERSKFFIHDMCRCCRYNDDCLHNLPENIGQPVPSDRHWIPSTVGCDKFKWD